MSQDEVMSNSEEIKPVVVSIVKLYPWLEASVSQLIYTVHLVVHIK